MRKHPARSAVVLVSFWLLTPRASAAAIWPPGYEETTYATMSGGLVAFAFAPGGDLWLAQSGPGEGMHLWLQRNGIKSDILTIQGTTGGERGIEGIQVDPDYAANGWLWVYYTAANPPHNVLSHFTHVVQNGQDLLVDETVVIEGPPTLAEVHNGGCLAFDEEGNVYLGMGEDGQGSTFAQDTFDLRGKILRVRRDGSIPVDNPFADGMGGDPRVWAWGVRNPFRCDMQPELDNLFFGDVGSFRYEEINVGVPGGNFGWANQEGDYPPGGVPGVVYPLYSYPSDDPAGNAVCGGDHVEGDAFGPGMEGNYIWGDFSTSRIYRMVLDENNAFVSNEEFATGAQGPVQFAFGPGGDLFYASRYGNSVRRVRYVGGTNRPPVAEAEAIPSYGDAPLDVSLDGSASYDPDDDPITREWDLGDGGSDSGPVVQHTYAQGVYDALLSVEDSEGATATKSLHIVSGNHPPTPTIVTPTAGATYNAGDVLAFSGTASDAEEGAVPCSRHTWQVAFHHDGHTHPFFGPEKGACSDSVVIPDRGEAATTVFYRVHLRADDTGVPVGPAAVLTGETTVDVLPNLTTFRLESQPETDLTLEIDTVPAAAPIDQGSVVNFIRQIGAVDGQVRNGKTWNWVSWSDGGAENHEIHAPAAATTYVATFGCAVEGEVRNVQAGLVQGMFVLTWDRLEDDCLEPEGTPQYRVFAAKEVRPQAPPGTFPDDPAFRVVGDSPTHYFAYAPQTDDQYFLVTGIGNDKRPGPAGHYGSP